jgi:hypothetical protein
VATRINNVGDVLTKEMTDHIHTLIHRSLSAAARLLTQRLSAAAREQGLLVREND